MAFMIPMAEHMTMYHVETNRGTEYVPEDACGKLCIDHAREPNGNSCVRCGRASDPNIVPQAYLEGTRVESVERHEGWYACLSAPGYLDRTDYMGPYETAQEAIQAVCDEYDCDENGDGVGDYLNEEVEP